MLWQSHGYEIVEYRSGFRDQVLELQAHLWSSDPAINAAYLDWKYIGNPYADRTIVYLALHEARIVGMLGAMGTRWQVGQPSQVLNCFVTADAFVHPDHRRRGLFENLNSAILQELSKLNADYVFSLSANIPAAACHAKAGWDRVRSMQIALAPPCRGQNSRLRQFARDLPILPSAYRRLRRYGGEHLLPSGEQNAPFGSFDRDSSRRSLGRFPRVCVERTSRPDTMAELVERIGNDGRMRHVRDKQFFTWRFQNPLSLYRFMFWERVGLEGYLVLQTPVDANEGSWVSIVDWEAESHEARVDLLRAASQWCSSYTLVVWSATLPDISKTLLSECGFHFVDEADSSARGLSCPSFLIRPVEDVPHIDWAIGGRQLLEMSDWDVRAIYSDNY